VLCIKPPPGVGDVRSIVARVLASGRAWIAVASFESSDVIRACITHGETTSEDVLELVQALSLAAPGPKQPRRNPTDSEEESASLTHGS
jgi:hypothetical protein